jgi:hypothetical protein
VVLQITVPLTEEGLEEAPKALEEPVEDVLHVELLSAQKELEDLEVHLDLQGALVNKEVLLEARMVVSLDAIVVQVVMFLIIITGTGIIVMTNTAYLLQTDSVIIVVTINGEEQAPAVDLEAVLGGDQQIINAVDLEVALVEEQDTIHMVQQEPTNGVEQPAINGVEQDAILAVEMEAVMDSNELFPVDTLHVLLNSDHKN